MANLGTLSSADIIDELRVLENSLARVTAENPEVSSLRAALAAKRNALREVVAIEARADVEDRRLRDGLRLQELEDGIRKAEALVGALRIELRVLWNRLTQEEVNLNACLRARGEFLRMQGKN
jgi:hypothetical protein